MCCSRLRVCCLLFGVVCCIFVVSCCLLCVVCFCCLMLLFVRRCCSCCAVGCYLGFENVLIVVRRLCFVVCGYVLFVVVCVGVVV